MPRASRTDGNGVLTPVTIVVRSLPESNPSDPDYVRLKGYDIKEAEGEERDVLVANRNYGILIPSDLVVGRGQELRLRRKDSNMVRYDRTRR